MNANQPSIPPIGVLVVHGIGNQRAGALSAEMANQLTDPGSPVIIEPPLEADRQNEDDPTCYLPPACRISVAGRAVLIREAHWAPLSDPGNPPVVRLPDDVVREFIQTVMAAWNGWNMTRMIRRLTRRLPPATTMVLCGLAGVLPVVCLLLAILSQQSDVATGVFVAILILYWLPLAYRNWRYQMCRLRRAAVARRIAVSLALICILPSIQCIVFMLLPMLVGEMLLFLAALVIAAAVASWIGWLLARLCAALGQLLNGLGMQFVRRWVHRLGWVIVVLPVQSLLQAVKATGNLTSIALTEQNVRTRLATIPWFLGVYVGFLILLVLCEFFLVPLLLCLQLGGSSVDLGTAAILLPLGLWLYLLFLKMSLPAVDLLLDVSNYHLGSADDRKLYHERVEGACRLLREAGCSELHILAHSLGSVITYDWLSTADTKNPGVTVLHTIGSPLNKFWYIDHAARTRRADTEGLPNVLKCHWTNYWAWSDWVSGRLVRYAGARVQLTNIRLHRLGPVLLSHVRYWKNRTVMSGIRTAIAAATS